MGEDTGTPLQAQLILDDSQFQEKLAGDANQVGAFAETVQSKGSPSLLSLATAFGAAQIAADLLMDALKAAPEFVVSAVKSFADLEQTQTRMSAALTNAGIDATKAVPELIAYADALSQVTLYTKPEIEAAETMAANFGLNTQQIEGAIDAASRLSVITGGDLTSSMQMIIQATEGHINRLARWGIEVDKNLTPAQKLQQIIDQMARGHVAAADATNADALAISNASMAWDNSKRAIGECLLAMEPVQEILRNIPGLAVMVAEDILGMAHVFVTTAEVASYFAEAVAIAFDPVHAFKIHAFFSDFRAGAKGMVADITATEKKLDDFAAKGSAAFSGGIVGGAGKGMGKGAGTEAGKEPKDEIKKSYMLTDGDLAEILADLQKDNDKIRLADDKLFEQEASENLKYSMQIKNYHQAAKDENDRHVIAQMAINDKYLKGTVEWDAAMDREAKKHQQEDSKIQEDEVKAREENLKAAEDIAGSIGDALGVGQKTMALVKIPLEGALAAVDFAAAMTDFATPGGQAAGVAHMVASAAHLDAAVQLAKAAGAAGGSHSASGGSGGGGSSSSPAAAPAAPAKQSSVVVNLGGRGLFNKNDIKDLVLGLNEAWRDNVHIEFAN